MGLFDGVLNNGKPTEAEIKEAEETVIQSLQKNPLLEMIDERIAGLENQELWLTTSIGFYDQRRRKVLFERDAIIIQAYEVQYQSVTDQNGRYSGRKEVEVPVNEVPVFMYTLKGYKPLSTGYGTYDYKKGEKASLVPTRRVNYLWASIVREHIKEMREFKQCEFEDVKEAEYSSGDRTEAYFKYKVPKLEFKDWF